MSPADLDLKRSDVAISDAEVETLIAERNAARGARDFARSDQIRDQLASVGVTVEDQPGGVSTWRWT